MEESVLIGDFGWCKVFVPEFYSVRDDDGFGVCIDNPKAVVVQ